VNAGRPTWLRTAAVFAAPLVLLPLVVHQAAIELGSPLFRDAVQNQYTGWCVSHGVKLYSGIGAPDGPFIHFLHALIQAIAGIRDSACRRVDLVIHVVGASAMGALLAPAFSQDRRAQSPSRATRAAWALLTVCLWLSWYLSGGWCHTVQRDPYYALFGYLGLVLLYASAEMEPAGARAAAAVGGALTTLVVFTRHSGVAFPAAALVGLFLTDDAEREMRGARARAAAAGALVALGGMALAMAAFCSLRGFWFWYVHYPFGYYRWVGKQNGPALLVGAYAEAAIVVVVLTLGVLLGVSKRILPRRTASFVVAAVLFLVAACMVGKGWPNHVQQCTAASIPLAVLLLGKLSDRRAPLGETRYRVATALAVVFVVYRAAAMLIANPGWANQAEEQADIAPAIAVGEYVKRHTRPEDTMFLYGHELHAALYAERRPAVPYVANMMINTEGWYRSLPAAPGQGPSPSQRAVMLDIQASIAADTCERLVSKPPAAMVFLDESLGHFHHGVAEVSALCPALPGLLSARYEEMTVPGGDGYHVFLKKM
jgi:hypothetical protein